MNIIVIMIGVFFFGYGIYVAVIRKKSPEKLGKYTAMKEKFGSSKGNIIHIIFYTVLPIVVGIGIIMSAILK